MPPSPAVKRRLRVAYVDYVLEPDQPGQTGLSDIVWGMATALTDCGHEAHTIASYHTDHFPDERVTVHNFSTPPIGYRNVLGHFLICARAAQIIRRLQPDIVHAPEYFSTAVLLALGIKLPIVLTVPGNIFHRIQAGNPYEWYYTQILKWAARKSARGCARIIAVSQEMKTWWEWTGSQPQNTCVIPYGVDPNLFYPIPGARAKLGFPAQQMTLVYAGRFSAEKGLLDLLQALALVKDQAVHKSLKVYLIGSGPQESRLRDFIKTHRLDEVVCIQTWVTKTGLAAWYSAADALVLPSHSEAFSRTIPEALSCGAPVIGSAISGTQDHITPQVNGFLFPPGDTASLAQILFTILDHPERLAAMRPAASEYARRTFPWQVVMQSILQEVYYPLSNL